MTRILHIWQSHYPWDVRVAKLNRIFRDQGHAVVTLARHRANESREAEFEGTRITRVGVGLPNGFSLPMPLNPFWTRAIAQEALRISAQVLLVRDLPLAASAVSVAKQLKLPVILDMAEHYPEAMRTWKKYSSNAISRFAVHTLRIPDRIEARVIRSFDAIWVVCEEQKERLVREYDISPEKIVLVLNTPEISNLTPIDSTCHLKRSRSCFAYHGLLCDDRELETVFLGFDLAADRYSDIKLLIAGGGESEGDLRRLRSTLRHKERIEMIGRYEPSQIHSLYERTDFGIVSLRKSIFTEHTLANKFFDYASFGKPFVYTDIGPLRRVMNEMKCGVGFTAGSPESFAETIGIIRQRDYNTLSQNGIRSIRTTFNWNVDAERALRAIETVTQGDRS